MKKLLLIPIILLMITNNAYAETKGSNMCHTQSGYLFTEDKLINNATYMGEVNKAYTDVATTTTTRYSSISCSEQFGIETKGTIDKVLSGTGFDYPIKVTVVKICKATFQYNLYTKDYKKANSATKKGMNSELSIYKKWLDSNKYYVSSDEMSLTAQDPKNEKYEELNKNFIIDETKTSKTEVLNKSASGKASSTTVELWVKTFTTTYTYIPIAKKTISAGERYGEVILDTEDCTNCTTSDNKIYTDFEAGYGNYPLNISVKYKTKGWTINSSCGYNIYNKGSVDSTHRVTYRQISLTNPFLGKTPTTNWKNYQENKWITGNEYNKTPLYVVTLNQDSISRIREYNNLHKNDYLDYENINKNALDISNYNYQNRYISNFIKQYITGAGGS